MTYLSNDLDFQYRMVYIVYWNSQRRIIANKCKMASTWTTHSYVASKFPVDTYMG